MNRKIHSLSLIAAILLCNPSISYAADAKEFMILPQISGITHNNLNTGSSIESDKIDISVDIFYNHHFKGASALVELYISEDEIDFERLYFKIKDIYNVDVSIGRMHIASGYWNTHNHHGTYFQETITRPYITNYEHDGGIIPQHISGIKFDVEQVVNTGQINYIWMLGYGPYLKQTDSLNYKLHALNLTNIKKQNHDTTLVYAIKFLSDKNFQDTFGISFVETKIKTNFNSKIELKIINAYLYLAWDRTELTTSLFNIKSSVNDGTSLKNGSFYTGYVQLGYKLYPDITIYSRFENSNGINNNTYLDLFSTFIDEQEIVGARYEFIKNQTITLELANINQKNDQYQHLKIQWSALY